jgi:hypothetical protein
MLIGAGLAPGFQLLGEIGQWIRSGHSFHPTLLHFSAEDGTACWCPRVFASSLA